MAATRLQVDEFLKLKRIALVGVSHDKAHFSRIVWQEFRKRGYEIVPVNPALQEVEGATCYARVQDIAPGVEGALLMTPPQVTDQVVRDCAEAHFSNIWMHKGEGIGSVSPAAVAYCQQHQMQVVDGLCPFMFLPSSGFLHGFHGWFKKMTGTYPK